MSDEFDEFLKELSAEQADVEAGNFADEMLHSQSMAVVLAALEAESSKRLLTLENTHQTPHLIKLRTMARLYQKANRYGAQVPRPMRPETYYTYINAVHLIADALDVQNGVLSELQPTVDSAVTNEAFDDLIVGSLARALVVVEGLDYDPEFWIDVMQTCLPEARLFSQPERTQDEIIDVLRVGNIEDDLEVEVIFREQRRLRELAQPIVDSLLPGAHDSKKQLVGTAAMWFSVLFQPDNLAATEELIREKHSLVNGISDEIYHAVLLAMLKQHTTE